MKATIRRTIALTSHRRYGAGLSYTCAGYARVELVRKSMDYRLLENVLECMRESLRFPQQILSQMFNIDMDPRNGLMNDGSIIDSRDLEPELSKRVIKTAKRFGLYLEMLDLPGAREEFLKGWDEFGSNYGQTKYDDEHEIYSESIDYLNEVFLSLRPVLGSDTAATCIDKGNPLQDQLEYTLKATAQILHNAHVNPSRESDIQKTMNKHLSTVFRDYTKTPHISKPIANFKPDGGIISLRSAIEFKYCDTENSVKTAFRGLTEDLSGYSGSLDWTRFYGVVYQTKAFVTQEALSESLRLSGNGEKWTLIVVTGGA